ncbi:hypothetical protein [Pedobacter namyangjuensis]|uniref:hypothetical protein n=1 Tax=Pedobacter namyangjuensis TaxID=600626 RepID=UPI000DE2FBD7|nr:hypothetical protein [Pedobacter namyangjuensis]
MTSPNENKKLTKAHFIIFGLMILAFAAYGYYELVLKTKLNGATLIDNPTAQAISVKIDGKTYEIPANSFVKAELEIGAHKIDCQAFGIVNQDLTLEPTEYGVINPTKSKYVTYNIIFTKKDLRDQFKPYDVEGREIYSLLGAPEVSTALFIPDRTLGKGNIDVKEPSTQTYNKMNQDYAYLSKIFRLKEFFEFYDKNNK